MKSVFVGDDAYQSASRRNLRRIFLLRWVVVLFLAAIAALLWGLHIPVHGDEIALSMAAFLVLNGYTVVRLMRRHEVAQFELFWQLVLDILILAGLFYFTGGYSNPFVWMFLLPIAVGAVALQRRNTWMLAFIAMLAYSVLVFYHIPLSHLHMHYQEGRDLDIHLVGMWLGFVVSASIMAFFVTRIGQNLRDYDQQMAEAREKILENDHWVSLGTLAASAAHELGTPLSTMAMLSEDLQTHLAPSAAASESLQLMRAQIQRCKTILANLAHDAGQLKADAGQRVPLMHWLKTTVERWNDTRPATALTVTYEGCELAPSIVMDRTLVQTLQNLLDNAADASPEQVVCVCAWRPLGLEIQIRDFGAGFTQEVLQQMGTPFFRAKSSTGMGLGVYLSKTVMARFGGELLFSNHPEGGAQVSLRLPRHSILFSSEVL